MKKEFKVTKKQKWALALAIATIIVAPQAAFASAVTSLGGTTTPTTTNVYSCASGDTLNGQNCVTPIVHHPAVTASIVTTTYAATRGGVSVANCPAGHKDLYLYFPGPVWVCDVPMLDNDPIPYPTTYTCNPGDVLDQQTCTHTEGTPAQSAYDTPGTTYPATATPTLGCSSGYQLINNNCVASGATVFDTGSLKSTVFGFITGNLLTGIVGLLVLGLSIGLAIRAVRKYARS